MVVDWVSTGRVAWVFEENLVPDDLLAGNNLNEEDPDRVKASCARALEPDFVQKVRPGDFFVGEDGYGYARPGMWV